MKFDDFPLSYTELCTEDQYSFKWLFSPLYSYRFSKAAKKQRSG